MTNINDTIEIHDGVALVLCRHDDARGQNITAEGAAWAYALGKHMGNIFRIDSPEYIIHSPISRARNTAKMHQIGMKVNNISNPKMKYDPRLHEHASTEVGKEAIIDAINETRFFGVKTIEVVTHSNNPVHLAQDFGANPSDQSLGYGGIVVVKADSWEDMIAGKNTWCESYYSSRDAVNEIIGNEQTAILDYMFNLKGDQQTFKELVKSHTPQDTQKWVQDLLEGKDVVGSVPPTEYMEIYDAYKFWVQNMALAVGITPEEDTPLYAELTSKLLGHTFQTFSEKFLINEDRYDGRDPKADGMGYAYPILNAFLKGEEARQGIKTSTREAGNQVVADILEDFPGYRDSMLVGQGRDVQNTDGTETITEKNASYHIKDGDDGEHHPGLNAAIWKMLKAKEAGKN